MTLFGLVLVPASPASAGDPADLSMDVRQGSLQSQAGGQPATLVFAITNNGPGVADDFVANVNIPFGDRGVTLASSSPSCNQVGGPTQLSCPVSRLDPGQSTVFTLVITPPPAGAMAATESLSSTGQVAASDPGGDDKNPANDAGQFSYSINGSPPSVTQISGTVADSGSGQPLPGVNVLSRDVNGSTCSAITDATGTFTCIPNPPMAGGQVTIQATIAGYTASSTTVNSTNGAVAAVALALTKAAPAAPSPKPSAATPSHAVASPQPQALTAHEDGFPWDTLFVILGIVVVLAGLGAVGFWLYKRQDRESGPIGPDPGSGHPGSGALESILPTMRIQAPLAGLNDPTATTPRPQFDAPTTVSPQPTNFPGSPMAVHRAGNESTAAWNVPGDFNGAGHVNRSTEPIQVSGAGWSTPGASPIADRTAEWSVLDGDPAADAPTAPNEFPTSAPPSQFPTSAPPTTGSRASARYGTVYGQRNPEPETAEPTPQAARAYTPLDEQHAAALPTEMPPPPQWGTPGRAAYGGAPSDDDAPSSLAGWDSPPAVVPPTPPPMPASAPPFAPQSAPPFAAPQSGLPYQASYASAPQSAPPQFGSAQPQSAPQFGPSAPPPQWGQPAPTDFPPPPVYQPPQPYQAAPGYPEFPPPQPQPGLAQQVQPNQYAPSHYQASEPPAPPQWHDPRFPPQ